MGRLASFNGSTHGQFKIGDIFSREILFTAPSSVTTSAVASNFLTFLYSYDMRSTICGATSAHVSNLNTGGSKSAVTLPIMGYKK